MLDILDSMYKYISILAIASAMVFGLYYLIHLITIENKKKITNNSIVVILPIILGFINTVINASFLLIILFNTSLNVFVSNCLDTLIPTEIYNNGKILFTIPSMYRPFILYIMLYVPISIPISIGSMGIIFVEMEKKYITKNRFLLVLLLNIISVIIAMIMIIFFSDYIN